jgi:hypothetical protein
MHILDEECPQPIVAKIYDQSGTSPLAPLYHSMGHMATAKTQ